MDKQYEYITENGKEVISIVRTNLMSEEGYTPYCGENIHGMCSNPRTYWNGDQFKCPECRWVSQYPSEFIKRYKAKWNK
jgi:predicted RNA-binding Zn-ribbon protein involved in translation (DUF1610 family)